MTALTRTLLVVLCVLFAPLVQAALPELALNRSLEVEAGTDWVSLPLETPTWGGITLSGNTATQAGVAVSPADVLEQPGTTLKPKPYANTGYTQYQLAPTASAAGLEVDYAVAGDFGMQRWEEVFEISQYIVFADGSAYGLTFDRHPGSIGLYLRDWQDGSWQRVSLQATGQERHKLRAVVSKSGKRIGFWIDGNYQGAFDLSLLNGGEISLITQTFSLQNYAGDKDFGAWPVITSLAYLADVMVSADGLIAHYPLMADANDKSPNGNHGTLKGAVAFGEIAGKKGAYFSGNYIDYIRIPHRSYLNLNSSTGFTLSAWVYSENSDGIVVSKGRDIAGSWRLGSGGRAFGMNNLPTNQEVSIGVAQTEFAQNGWNRVTVVVDATNQTMDYYLNGTKKSSASFTTGFAVSTSHDLVLGRHDTYNDGSNDWPYSFKGWISDLRIYNRALSGSEIVALESTGADCVFNWAEQEYPALFLPRGAVSLGILGYYYRYYTGTNAYLATDASSNRVFYLGPLTGNALTDLGPLSDWLSLSACQ